MKANQILLALTAAFVLPASVVFAQPVVKDIATTIYAAVPDPESLSFAADGTIYVGRDNSGSGGGYSDAVKIHRVAVGGVLVTEFGSVAVRDPDVVIVDLAGVVSGTTGAVLVGGDSPGKISKITSDGAVTTLFGPSLDYANPSSFTFDLTGRFLFTTYDNGRVYASSGGTPGLLFSVAHANGLEVDAANRIVVNSGDETHLRLYTADGTLSNANFATVKAGTPLARAAGGTWGTDIYAVGTGGELLRVDLDGAVSNVGSGFANIADIRFGPDGALYASDFGNDRIYRFAPPTVPGAETTIYARVTDPQKLAFAPDGTLFLGRDNSGSGGGNADSVKIHRIAPGGTSVTEFGTSAIPDPDAVVFDAAGAISGVAGSVIVGGVWSGSSGALSRIAPDESMVKFFGPVSWVVNPTDLIFDHTGRLLFTDIEGGKVFAMANATPVALFSVILPVDIAVDALERIVVSSSADSMLRLYSADGAPINLALAQAQPNTPLVRGPGGFWGTEVYFVSTNSNLQCVDTLGAIRTVGAGFGGLDDLAFGPDGALYASHFANDLVWRIAPTDERPRLTIVPVGNLASLIWPSVTNRSYQLQSTTNLAPANWLDEGAPFAGTDSVQTNTIPIGTAATKFFRLLLLGN